MDITISPVSGVFRFPTPVAATPAAATATNSATDTSFGDSQAQQQALAAQTPDTGSNTPAAVSTAIENKYEAAVQQIAQSFKGSYAVSDKDFTIFKDNTGKYITRYVSLRDGSVTYVPAAPAVTRLPSAAIAITA